MAVESFEKYLSVKNAIFPTFADNGNHLLFLSDISGTNQIWLLNLKEENAVPVQLTESENRVTGLHPNSTATAFIFTRDSGGDENDQLYLLELDFSRLTNGTPAKKITPLVENPQTKNNFGAWRPDAKAYCFSGNARQAAFFDIYIQEQNEAGDWLPARLVYQEDDNLYPQDWSADGRYILFRRSNTNLDQDLFLLDLTAPEAAPRLLTPHEEQTWFGESSFSPDGKFVYTTSDKERNFNAVVSIEVETGELFPLAWGDWDCNSLSIAPNGTQFVYEMNYSGFSRLFVRQIGGLDELEIAGLPPGVALGIGLWESPLRWSPDGTKIAFSFHSPVHNADIWLYDLETRELKQLTYSDRAGLDFSKFAQPQIVNYPTFDEREIPALLYLPPQLNTASDANLHLPFIVLVHGGPEGQSRFSWNGIIQYYVSRGYGVLAPNVRGSRGYGKEYLGLDDVRKRPDSVADLAAAAEWLKQSGFADPQKIAVYGQSYGGFMVLAAITGYPDLWAAGVDIYGIANMLTFLENTGAYRLKLRIPEYGHPVHDRDFLVELSPIHKIDRIKAPLLVIHGARDPRVPLIESEQMVKALQERQQPVEFIVFEDEGHGITKLRNKLIAFPAAADFLDKYLK